MPALWKYRVTGDALYKELAKKEGNKSTMDDASVNEEKDVKGKTERRMKIEPKKSPTKKTILVRLVSDGELDDEPKISTEPSKSKAANHSKTRNNSGSNSSSFRTTPVSQRKSYARFAASIKVSSSPKKAVDREAELSAKMEGSRKIGSAKKKLDPFDSSDDEPTNKVDAKTLKSGKECKNICEKALPIAEKKRDEVAEKPSQREVSFRKILSENWNCTKWGPSKPFCLAVLQK